MVFGVRRASINPQMMKLRGGVDVPHTPHARSNLVTKMPKLIRLRSLVLMKLTVCWMRASSSRYRRVWRKLPAKRQNLLFSPLLTSKRLPKKRYATRWKFLCAGAANTASHATR
ncbi:hypothetical protein KCP69_20405 [Salmonella enterica subsp. enterica]|nr:hypothetical protein KCP69_20405 [Salmonella enterica subsp. enterica]